MFICIAGGQSHTHRWGRRTQQELGLAAAAAAVRTAVRWAERTVAAG